MTEEIKSQLDYFKDEPKYLRKVIDELEQENKELKEQAQLDGECIDKLIEARDMYAKALEEIRELAKNGNAIDGIRLKIIDKINEVLGND